MSGDVRKSIKGLIKMSPPVSLSIGTDVYYGVIWYLRGRDFLRPPVRKNRTRIKKMILDGIMDSYPKGGIA